MDLVEREDSYLLRADLPGVHDEDVSVELEEGVLTVSGERKPTWISSKPRSKRAVIAAPSRSAVLKPEAVKPRRIRIGTDRDVIEA